MKTPRFIVIGDQPLTKEEIDENFFVGQRKAVADKAFEGAYNLYLDSISQVHADSYLLIEKLAKERGIDIKITGKNYAVHFINKEAFLAEVIYE